MLDWNVVVSVRDRGFAMACDILNEYGTVARSGYYNVLVMKVASPVAFLAKLEQRLQANSDLLTYVARIAPATETFDFGTPQEFDAQAREVVTKFVPQLAGKSFHVRMHRRGWKGELSSIDMERLLNDHLLAALNEAGTSGTIRFDDADAIIDLETVDHRAGLSLWTQDDLKRYPFLKPD